ncbi:DUF6909 family protein [Spirochaeta cellobiosiphila]|uniref:DUF6909 family protein n=1 Tax=Spirochaeta cellobiosiphila TaxID=504483 RepID=UPI00040D2299|nr:cyclic nucleotide-binding domain-containing protein [Spirochaeta cellobiosiphila]
MRKNDKKLIELLENMIPFRFLALEEKKALTQRMERVTFREGEFIFSKGDRSFEIYLIEEGLVGTGSITPNRQKPLRMIRSGHYFGERAILFKQPERIFSAKALSDCVLWSLKGSDFISLVIHSRAFAHSLGNILRDKQGLFDAFDHYTAEVKRGLNSSFMDWRKILRLYRTLQPALHPEVLNNALIDTNALSYAIRRLPQNVTSVFSWLLTDDVPPEYRSPGDFFDSIPTAGRRREAWKMMEGKDLILLRHGFSDLLDFISCLCTYSVEAEKIRKRLSEPKWLGFLQSSSQIEGLPFSKEEAEGLYHIWANNTSEQIQNILLHNEAFNLTLHKQIDNYNSRRSEKWTLQIRQATEDLLQVDPADLSEDWEVHIISSNTHSVINCLNPSLASHREAILSWAKERQHPYLSEHWLNQTDLSYALFPDYVQDMGPVLSDKEDLEHGILRIENTASTGVQVQLVNMEKLKGWKLDDSLEAINTEKKKLIVNIDYAFGEQAEEIIRNLIMLYGHKIRSINILGKAGALLGKRGDILVPTAFLEQVEDRYFLLQEPCDEACKRLRDTLQVGVHKGPLLTVSGTLLQNKEMLHFYRKIWGCIGLEMEGSFYSRPIRELSDIGILSKNIDQRYFYYVSDLPLGHHSNLSQPLKRSEGLPPLYGITREILNHIIR